MNQNEMERYYWRTGQRWSGDNRPLKTQRAGPKLMKWTVLLLAVVLAVRTALILLQR